MNIVMRAISTGAVLSVWFGFLIGTSLADEIPSTNMATSDLQNTATQVEQYINEHLFDPDRFM